MTVRLLVWQPNLLYFSPTFICSRKPSLKSYEMPLKLPKSSIGRRTVMTSLIFGAEAFFSKEFASGFDFTLVAPDQTIEEAESSITGHAQALLQVKDLIDSDSWTEAQRELRKSSSYLKQDIYTIIQGKPGSERPVLRKLYSDLFNNVTRLDYAARDRDGLRIRKCYDNIVLALNDILSKL
uniref:PQL-like protein n=1 Tax=Melianthus villosus TaxID=377280 RepID=A0A0F7GX11_9ROSI